MGVPQTPEDAQVREEILDSAFLIQFFPEDGDKNNPRIAFTEIKKDGTKQVVVNLHDLVDNESDYWGCVNSRKGDVGLATAVMLCLRQ
jgi:hypothetical protein